MPLRWATPFGPDLTIGVRSATLFPSKANCMRLQDPLTGNADIWQAEILRFCSAQMVDKKNEGRAILPPEWITPPGAATYFISYSRADSDFVLRLAKDLRNAGIPIWLDQIDIVAGTRWDQAIETALASCSAFIVALSPESIASVNVMDEVSFALEEKKSIFPVLIKPCKVPFRLRRLQAIDFGADYDSGIAQLLPALRSENPATARLEKAVALPATEVSNAGTNESVPNVKKITEFIKTWFVPFNALLLFGGFIISLIGKFTDQVRAVQSIAVTLIAIALIIGMLKLVARIFRWKSTGARHQVYVKSFTSWSAFSLILITGLMLAISAKILGLDPVQNNQLPQSVAVPSERPPASAPTSRTLPSAVSTDARVFPLNSNALSLPETKTSDVSRPVGGNPVGALNPPPPAKQPLSQASTASTSPVADAAPTGLQALQNAGKNSGQLVSVPAVSAPIPTAKRIIGSNSRQPARCALILQKAAVDEPLSTEEKQFMRTSCQ